MSKSVLVFGGRGALGSAVVNSFNKQGWNTISIDFAENSSANKNVVIKGSGEEEVKKIIDTLGSTKVDSIVCAAGGWSSGGIKSDDYFKSVQKMLDYNLSSAVATAYLAGQLLNENGVVIFTGATAATKATPGMIGYGISKVATHHIIKSLAQADSGLPKGALSVGILPVILDTPSNRAGMPGANFDDWTPVDELAESLFKWSSTSSRPENGSLVIVETKNRVTTYTPTPLFQ